MQYPLRPETETMHRLLNHLLIAVVLVLELLPHAQAQTLRDHVPAGAKHCELAQPPADAGLVPAGGGFVVVYPRNAQLRDDYTGCKVFWVAETGNRFLKLATLYFNDGKLTVAATHEFRAASEDLDALCLFPAGKSLMPDRGRQIQDSGCNGYSADDMFALRTPSYPRKCAEDAGARECGADPR